MSGLDPFTIFILSVGLGLVGFIEPCSIGSTLIVIKHLEGKRTAAKIAELGTFTLARAVFTGLLGLAAIVLGSAFIGFQKAAWAMLGTLYAGLGLVMISGRAGWLMAFIGPHLARVSPAEGSGLLGLIFGMNIPACAAPLLIALLGTAAVAGAAGHAYATGFVSLAIFGLALSAPLVVAVLIAPARRMLDRLSGLSRRFPLLTGALLLALGAWVVRDAYVTEAWPEQQSLLQRLEARRDAKQTEIQYLGPSDLRPHGQSGARRAGRSYPEPADDPERDEK